VSVDASASCRHTAEQLGDAKPRRKALHEPRRKLGKSEQRPDRRTALEDLRAVAAYADVLACSRIHDPSSLAILPMSPPRRICSLLPSATEIIAQLGLADRLVGVSAECRWPEQVIGKPVVSNARVDTAALTSEEIDKLVRDSTSDGGSLYAVDAELIDRLEPDLIVTQDL
jgi:hypothetical protein